MRYVGFAAMLLLSSVLVACGGATELPDVDESSAITEAQPITLSGTGPTATEPVAVPWDNSRAIFSHNGSRNFAVMAYRDGVESLLVNIIGKFEGARPLFGAGEVYFDIDADGDWSVTIEPLGQADGAAYSGSGSAVSGYFDAPPSGPWAMSHDGSRNFVVHLHCADSTDLIENEIGEVSGSTVVNFGADPCFWEVEGDGSWSLAPK